MQNRWSVSGAKGKVHTSPGCFHQQPNSIHLQPARNSPSKPAQTYWKRCHWHHHLLCLQCTWETALDSIHFLKKRKIIQNKAKHSQLYHLMTSTVSPAVVPQSLEKSLSFSQLGRIKAIWDTTRFITLPSPAYCHPGPCFTASQHD